LCITSITNIAGIKNMNIYSFSTFNLTKILFTAEELGIDYTLHLLDLAKGEHKTPEHLQRHPLGKVPAVELNGQFFIESNSICRLLAEENDNRLYADTPIRRAEINQWIDLMGYHLGRWIGVYFFEEGIKPNLLGESAEQKNIEEAAGFLAEQLPVMESALAKNTFICGPDISIADIISFAHCQVQEYTSFTLEDYPYISKWYQSMSNRPAILRAMAQLPNGRVPPYPA